jgi:hypothetical protein
MLSKKDAIALVEARINEFDPDWPTKPRQVVCDELTQERPDGWLFYYAAAEEMRVPGRDPEPEDNTPWFVNRGTGDMSLASL